jgi:hypothetical protein
MNSSYCCLESIAFSRESIILSIEYTNNEAKIKMNYVDVLLFHIFQYKQTINKRKKREREKLSIRHLLIRKKFIGTNRIEFLFFSLFI